MRRLEDDLKAGFDPTALPSDLTSDVPNVDAMMDQLKDQLPADVLA